MIIVLSLFCMLSAFAQQFQYNMDGSYQLASPAENGSATTVTYRIRWNETSTTIQGIYQDNYFSNQNPIAVTGTVGAEGKRFNVTLPSPVLDVVQIVLSTSLIGVTSGTISVKTETLTPTGASSNEFSGYGLMSLNPGADVGGVDNNEESCIVGFGALTKYCGIYNGLFHELSDTNNKCDFIGRSPRLEFSSDTIFRLILDYIPGGVDLPTQVIGAFLPSPVSETVYITSRSCGNVPATSFNPANCKTLSLSGSFHALADQVQFAGTYVIRDDFSGESCSYSMSLSREVIY